MMLGLLSIITICVVRVKSLEVCDDKYSLTTSGIAESVGSFEQAKQRCINSWLLEIYDDKVVELLKKLNLDNQGILLGMKRYGNNWMWSNGMTSDIVQDRYISDDVACITNSNGQVRYTSKTMNDVAGAICSKTVQEGNCTGWIHNGMCHFKPSSFNNTWFQAHNECIKYGAILAIFDKETDFNMSFIDSQFYWVSLSRRTWCWTRPVGNPYTLPAPNSNPNCATTDSSGTEWKSVFCNGQFLIVCMRESTPENSGCTHQATNSTIASVSPNIYHKPTTQPSLPKPGGNSSEPTNAELLSIGAKAGIGVGVSMLLIIIIISGVLGFKYFHQFKTKSQSEIKSQDYYEKPDFSNSQNHVYQGLETK